MKLFRSSLLQLNFKKFRKTLCVIFDWHSTIFWWAADWCTFASITFKLSSASNYNCCIIDLNINEHCLAKRYHQSLKEITKRKLEHPVEDFMAISGVISNIF